MKQNEMNTASHQQGFTLIELLVSMLVGLIIMAGVVQVFQGNFINARYQDNMALLQENGRFAMAMLSQNIKMGGYYGCLTGGAFLNNALDGTDANFTPEYGIQGWEYTNTHYTAAQTGTYPFAYLASNQLVNTSNGDWADADGALSTATINISAVPGSDMIRVWSGSELGAVVESVASDKLTLSDASNVPVNSIVVVNSCDVSPDIVQACAITGNDLELTAAGCTPGVDLSNDRLNILTDASVSLLRGDLFYIGRRNDSTLNPPSLFQRPLTNAATLGAAEELVEGVENFQVMYGVDVNADGSADTYATAKQIDSVNWENVVSVRIFLMVGSIDDDVVSGSLPIFFNGATHTPTDRRVRQAFTRTINLRNRTL